MTPTRTEPQALLRPGETCWRVEQADRASLIIDADVYFRYLRQALTRAERAVYLIGWDFDLRIEMVPGESDEDGNAPDGWPNVLGDFLKALVDRRPELRLHILKWDGAMLAELASQAWETLTLKLASDRIRFALDSHHPAGACHHQKIVVIDDHLAFCGGIDVTAGRWDTRDHLPDDPRRADPDGSLHQPWHDVTTALEGPVAAALGDLARARWQDATGETLDVPQRGGGAWPDDLEPMLRGADIGIARTKPRYHGEPLVDEIEQSYLTAIRTARRTIYIESQYLAAGTLCEAMEARLAEHDGPEIVVINPLGAESFLEDEAMNSVRSRMIRRLSDADRRGGGGRFAIFHPVNAAGTPIYVHAKVLIVDDRVIRVGSSNIDNRSMGFDTECDILFEADTDDTRATIRDITLTLLSEHLGSDPETIRAAWQERGALLPAIEALRRPEGRGLRPIRPHELDPLERSLAETRIFDPRHWPRNEVGKRDRVKHMTKRAMEPYQIVGTGLAAVLLGAGILGFGVWSSRRIARRDRDRGLAAPGISTHRSFRPPRFDR